jgi:two-component system chemotaxis response regulator CheY
LGRKVLIVDDAKFMRLMIKDILTGGGFEVAGEAEDGIEAVRMFKDLQPDLVTMDITMPNMNGIDALKAIRKIDGRAKVIMCTAMGQKSMVIESIQSGAVDFIVKPFQPDRVLQTITKVVEG